MFKFQRNQTKPELITILFVTSLYCLSQQRPRRSPIATEKHEQNIALRFGKKKPELQPESWKLNGNIFFKLILGDLDGKMTSMGYKSKQTKKHGETVRRANNLFMKITFQAAWSKARTSLKKLFSG